MDPNVGPIDQAARIALGFLMVVLAAAGVIGMWGYVGVVLVFTGGLGFCPAYRVFGVTTCSVASEANT